MSHQPRKYFVVVLQSGIPRTIKGANGKRLVPTDRTLEEVVAQRNLGSERPLFGWRSLAGARKHRDLEPCNADDRAAGWVVRIYERRHGKLEPVYTETKNLR